MESIENIAENRRRDRLQYESLLQRFRIQFCSWRPETQQIDFAVHSLILMLLCVFYGYFSMGMDKDPQNCYASEDEHSNQIFDK